MRPRAVLCAALWIWCSLFQLLPPVMTQSVYESNSTDLLFARIFDIRYSMMNPPRVNGTFNVTFDLAIAQLLELNEIKQTISMLTWRRMTWYDTRLSWRDRVFDGNLSFNSIKSIKIPNSQIWKPDLVVYNDVRETELDWFFYYATVRSDGFVRLNTPQLMKMSCAINVEYFPYDQQSCKMKIGSWTMDGIELNLLNISSHADLSSLEEDNEYCVVGAPLKRNSIKYACCDAPYPDITYKILLQRKPLYYEINLIMPCIAILVVALFGFRLPPESGERISLCVTVLLALSVFLQLASEHTPTQSDVVPLLSRYFMAAIGMSSMCVLGSILVLLLHFNGKQARPMGSRTELFFTLLCRLICYPGFEDSGVFRSSYRSDRGGPGGGRNRQQNGAAKSWISPSKTSKGQRNSSRSPATSATAVTDDMEVEEIEIGQHSVRAAPTVQTKISPTPASSLPLPQWAVDALDRVDATLYEIRLALSRSQDQKRRERRWEDAAQVTDRLLFYMSIAGFIGLSVAVFMARPNEAISAAANCKELREASMSA